MPKPEQTPADPAPDPPRPNPDSGHPTRMVAPEKFGQALRMLVEGDYSPYLRLAKARKHVEAARLHSMAFGLLGLPTISGEYSDGQEFMLKNLTTGTNNMESVALGLNNVATTYRDAEQANIIDSASAKAPLKEDWGFAGWFFQSSDVDKAQAIAAPVLGLVGWGVYLATKVKLTEEVMKKIRGLAWTGSVAYASMMTFIPDGPALDDAEEHWRLAQDELSAYSDRMSDVSLAFSDGWEGRDADTFQAYTENLSAELDECAIACENASSQLSSSITMVNLFQTILLLQSIGCLMYVIILEVKKNITPPARPILKALQEGAGAYLGITTATLLTSVFGALNGLSVGVFYSLISSYVAEKEPTSDAGHPPEDGTKHNGVDLQEVSLSPNEINQLFEGGRNRA